MRGVEARDTSEAAPYFFLSYAHSTWDTPSVSQSPDVWLVKLFEDLCGRVIELSGLPAAASRYVGFMDRGRRTVHADPPMRAIQALATCRVFVPLFSRRYFEDDDCGREWSAFSRRAGNNTAQGRGTSEAIIPALWVPVDGRYLPAAARSLQFNHADLGECYAANGFYGIIKLTRFQNAYQTAVDRLACLIVQAAKESPVAPEPVFDYTALVSAFGSEARSTPGGRSLRITIVAPRQGELPVGRSPDHYGLDAFSWNPYEPRAARGLAEHTADLARSLGYRPVVGDLGQHSDELLSSRPPSGPEVLIVDAWAATIDEYASLLRRLDTMNKPWVQLVVPWRRGDEESEAARDKLRSALSRALGHKLAEGRAISSSAVRGVPSLDDFTRVLPTVIMTAARQYLRHAPSFPPSTDPETERSRLSLSLPDLLNTELPGA